METLTVLRAIDVQDKQRGNSAERLRYLGYQVHTAPFLPAKSYLRFEAQFADESQLFGFIDARSWLTQFVPTLDGIDWFSVDEKVIHSLILAYPLELKLSDQHAPIASCKITELVADARALADYPRIKTANGEVLIARFVYGQTDDSAAQPADSVQNKLVSQLDFIIGYSDLPWSALTSVEIGDVLLVTRVANLVAAGDKNLFNYRQEHNAILIDSVAEGETQSEKKRSTQRGNNNMNTDNKLDDLPVELSFVLMEKTVTLAELKALAPGEVIELPPEQAMRVEIRANQRKLFQGELVQLSNGQLAVEVRQIIA